MSGSSRNRRRVALGTLLLAGAVFSGPAAGWGYEEAAVRSGGALTGRVSLKGPVPPTRIFHLIFSPNIEFCGRISDGKGNRLLKEFRVSDSGGFQGVVIAVVGVEKGKTFDLAPEMTIDTCRISPFVMPIRNRRPISIVNRDSVAHNIQGYTLKDDSTFAMFNQPMPPESTAVKEARLRKGHSLFRAQCGVHDFMLSWGIAVDNPYFAVTDRNGAFTIPDLPPGVYDVIAWHPHMKVQARQVVVPPDGTVGVNFAFDASEVSIPMADLQTDYRLQTALQPHHLVPPSVELQTP